MTPKEPVVLMLDGCGKLEMRDEATHALESTDPSMPYPREYRFPADREPTCCHGLISSDGARVHASVLLCAAGGPSAVHARSLYVTEDLCFVAIGPYIVCLSLPNLDVTWSTEVDSATCFGVLPTADGRALISHGELEVARVALSGEVVWTAAGADVLSGGLTVTEAEVHVDDFNHDTYVFDVQTGMLISRTANKVERHK